MLGINVEAECLVDAHGNDARQYDLLREVEHVDRPVAQQQLAHRRPVEQQHALAGLGGGVLGARRPERVDRVVGELGMQRVLDHEVDQGTQSCVRRRVVGDLGRHGLKSVREHEPRSFITNRRRGVRDVAKDLLGCFGSFIREPISSNHIIRTSQSHSISISISISHSLTRD